MLWVNSWTHNPKKKAVSSFETLGSIYPTTRRNNPEDLLPQYENSFVTITILQSRVTVGNAASFPTEFSCIFPCSLLSQLSLVTQVTRRLVVLWTACLGGVGGSVHEQLMMRKQHCLLSLSLSLSHTHTHTHTHTQKRVTRRSTSRNSPQG